MIFSLLLEGEGGGKAFGSASFCLKKNPPKLGGTTGLLLTCHGRRKGKKNNGEEEIESIDLQKESDRASSLRREEKEKRKYWAPGLHEKSRGRPASYKKKTPALNQAPIEGKSSGMAPYLEERGKRLPASEKKFRR